MCQRWHYNGVNDVFEKFDGPRAVTLQDGSVITLADLPARNKMRLVASPKAAVVRGVLYRLISAKAAQERYGFSNDEFQEWVKAVSLHGEAAVRARAVQKYIHLRLSAYLRNIGNR
tara:strand:+ start:1945 stop:2292 length:348 start_codon:yes stop_codon:yes gene_type:complete